MSKRESLESFMEACEYHAAKSIHNEWNRGEIIHLYERSVTQGFTECLVQFYNDSFPCFVRVFDNGEIEDIPFSNDMMARN